MTRAARNRNEVARLPRELTLLSKAARALAECKTVDEVKDIRDKAEAVRMYFRQAGESLELQNAAAEVKLRAERRGGAMLAEMEKHNGDPRLHDATRLSDLGLEKTQSHRWQRIAGIDDDAFDQHIEAVKADGKELTTAGVLRLASNRQASACDSSEERPWTLQDALTRLDRKVREYAEKWPQADLETMAHKLRSLSEELIANGRL